MEDTRAALAASHSGTGERGIRRWARRRALALLGRHRLLVGLSRVAAVGQRLRLVPTDRLGLPTLPLRERPLRPSGTDVWLHTGCVMDAWQRRTHGAVKAVVEATGAGVALPGTGGDCCGALAVHAGERDGARRLAERTMDAMPGEAPILVDSAGCGAQLKDYGRLSGTAAAEAFAARVVDVHERLAARPDRLPAPPVGADQPTVAVQDPCHLRHVQHVHGAVRSVLSCDAEVVEVDDDGLRCGAGGAFAVLQPELARDVRARKIAGGWRGTGARRVASANPGCVLHLRAGGVDVRHPLEYVAEALGHHDEIA
ncbi:MAG: (Fe-S)-binding protein [Acidimicrobiia bacterium]|nr:(Fe-S)-binding protein [Acidimicrobiia bacterium]